MLRTAIFICLALFINAIYCHGHSHHERAASELVDGISKNVDVQALNASAAEHVDNFKNKLKSKCDKNAGLGHYDKVLAANDDLQNCVKALVNVTELQDEIEKAKPTGDLDIVFKKYCLKKSTLKKCMANFTTVINPCLESQERETTKIMENVTDSLLNFICHKEGDRIALFIAAGGPECFQSKQQDLQECANATFSSYTPVEGQALSLNLETIPKLMFGVKECNAMEKFRQCSVKKFEGCSDPTPANIADSLFKFIKRGTPCENILNGVSSALVDDSKRTIKSAASTYMTVSIHTLMLLVTTVTFAYI